MKSNSTAQKLEQNNNLPTLQIVKNEAVKAEVTNEVTPEAPAEETKQIKVLTIEEIKRKNEVLKRLTDKFDLLTEKRRKIENFKISADRDTATVLVTDSYGEEFLSNSPKTIKKLIDFWTDEFNTALAEVESEIRENA